MINKQDRMQHKTFVLTETHSSFSYVSSYMKLEQPVRIIDKSIMCGLRRNAATLIVYLARKLSVADEEMIAFARAYDFPVFIVHDRH